MSFCFSSSGLVNVLLVDGMWDTEGEMGIEIEIVEKGKGKRKRKGKNKMEKELEIEIAIEIEMEVLEGGTRVSRCPEQGKTKGSG